MVCLLMAFPARTGLISPGPLTHQHAATPNGCIDCHSAAEQDVGGWTLVAASPHANHLETQKCLVCHHDFGENPNKPHSSSAQQIAQLTKTAHNRAVQTKEENGPAVRDWMTSLSKSMVGTAHLHGDLDCAACHKEHQGEEADLKLLTNQQCQVCHVSSFASFSQGHPEFDQYPFQRRTRIYFDHSTHFNKHFHEHASADKDSARGFNTQAACVQCHVVDAKGVTMELRPFEQTCAQCHEKQITDDSTIGWAAIGVPAIDRAGMGADEVGVGLWPESTPLHPQASGALPPLMKLLLSADSKFEQIRPQVENLNLADLKNASADVLTAVEDLAWVLKHNILAWSQGKYLPPTTGKSTAGQLAHNEIKTILDLIPTAQFKQIQDRWFPVLKKEIRSRKTGQGFEFASRVDDRDLNQISQDQRRDVETIKSGWYLQDTDLTLRYRPVGHADPVLKKLLDSVAHLASNSNDKRRTALINEVLSDVSSPHAPGRCVKCHTIDRSDKEVVINWRGVVANQNHAFTKFSHKSHMVTQANNECLECHRLKERHDSESFFRAEYVNQWGCLALDSAKFKCDFSPLQKSNCSQCHQQNSAGDSCLKCHNYHVR